jgi:hypothetical protein
MTDKTTARKWDEATVAQLLSIVGSQTPVSAETVAKAAVELEVSERSVASKLRNLEIEVVSLAKASVATFSEDETADLTDFVLANSGTYTYKELADAFQDGDFNAKQIQGKVLSLELTEHIKPSEKVEAVRTYTPEQETKFIALVKSGAFIEDIATALNKTVQSVRGKALSLTRNGDIDKIPSQKESHAKAEADPIEALGAGIASMTVAEIATATGKTERGIKTALTRRGVSVADHDGAGKRAKAEAKAA